MHRRHDLEELTAQEVIKIKSSLNIVVSTTLSQHTTATTSTKQATINHP
jgi:hypothetical protein